MNIDDVIHAHVQWKVNLRKALNTGVPPEKDPANFNACALSQWLAGEGRSNPSWAAIDTVHREFHATAAKVLSLAKTNRAAAEALLDGDFTQKSMKIVTTLSALKRKAA
jgi:hypothetical protein